MMGALLSVLAFAALFVGFGLLNRGSDGACHSCGSPHGSCDSCPAAANGDVLRLTVMKESNDDRA